MFSQDSAIHPAGLESTTSVQESAVATVRARYQMRAVVAAVMAIAFALALSTPATAATITVNSLADPGAPGICAYRDAITAANSRTRVNGCKAGSGNDTINFSVSGTIVIADALQFPEIPAITDSQLTINGPIAIGCGGIDTLIAVAAGATVKVNNLTMGGFPVATGNCRGAIINQQGGTLTIANSTVSGMVHPAVNSGTMTVTDSTFTKNVGDAGSGPTAVENFGGGTLTVTNSTMSDNVDPPIVNFEGTTTIANSTFTGNIAKGGSAIENDEGGILTATNCTFSGNTSENSGSIINDGELTVISSTFAGNVSNGAFNLGDPSGDIDNFVFGFSKGSLSLKNSIFAGSIDFTGAPVSNCIGPITDAGYNISDDRSCDFTTNTSRSNTNPGLSSDGLTNNGGPTQTIALAGNSPAIDAILLADCTDQNGKRLKTDQRGFPRPDAGENVCDIGAFETQDSCSQNQQGNNNCQ